MLRSFAAFLILTAALAAQNPTPFPADPGVLVPDGTLNASFVAGYKSELIVNTLSSLTNPATMVIGPGGDLYFTESVGSGCSAATATNVYRLPMNGRMAIQPATISLFSQSSMNAHDLAYDPITDALYAAGTCSQTGSVFRISNAGAITHLNPGTPLNDPDGIAVGIPAFSADPHAFLAVQDELWTMNLITLTMQQVTVDLTNSNAATLGNWGFMEWDPNTQTLLAGNVGRPTVRSCVEINFTSPSTAVVTDIGPDSVKPQCVDHNGIRYFSSLNQLGFLNPIGGGAHVFQPTVGSLASTARLLSDTLGRFAMLDYSTGDVIRIDRPLVSDSLVVSTGPGHHVIMDIQTPASRAGEPYLILANYTGSSPGTIYNSIVVPLNRDLISEVSYVMAQTGDLMTDNWLGTLDANGQAQARFRFPPGIIPSGVTFNLAFFLGLPEYSSNAIWVHVIP